MLIFADLILIALFVLVAGLRASPRPYVTRVMEGCNCTFRRKGLRKSDDTTVRSLTPPGGVVGDITLVVVYIYGTEDFSFSAFNQLNGDCYV